MNFQPCLYIIFSFILTLLHLKAVAATIISQANGNWSNTATWNSALPSNNDDVIIASGTTVNLNTSLPTSSSLLNLTIQSGAVLIVTVNTSTLRIKGNLINNGILNLWQTNSLQADITLYGNSNWSGAGTWNLSSVNIQGNRLEVSGGLHLVLNGSLSTNPGGSFNKVNQHRNITLTLEGTANSALPPLNADFYYGHIKLNKVSGTVSFLPSATDNVINFPGDLTLANANDRLAIGDNNTLVISSSVTGAGAISGGGIYSSLIIDNVSAPAINPLRVASGISLKSLIVNRTSGVVLTEGFTVREHLTLNNSARLTLSNQTLVLGANGVTPAPGIFSGDGFLVGSANANISIRGNSTDPTYLRFAQLNSSEYTINNFVVDKMSGGATGLFDGSSLIIRGYMDVHDNNQYEVGRATLTFNSVPHFYGTGCLKGSAESALVIAGNGTNSYELQFDQSNLAGHTLLTYSQSRRATITLANRLNIAERVSLTGNNSILASNGNLTLLSSAAQSAGISSLINGADVTGDVNVQVFLTGNNTDMKYRGFRYMSSPINDGLISAGQKKSLEQLKDYIIITGSGGASNGFDQGGNAQPFAQTLTLYDEPADFGQNSFIPIHSIFQSLSQASGFVAFFRGLQMGSYQQNAAKLNSPYLPPEPVTIQFKGIVNKFDIAPVTLRNSNYLNDNYNGYNLIGNPYPSAIDWTKVSRSTGVNDEVIIIKPGGGQATYKDGFSNNGGSPYIQTGQAFYVRTTADGSSVSFEEKCKTIFYPSRLLNQPFGNEFLTQNQSNTFSNPSRANHQVIKLGVENAFSQDQTTIVFKSKERAEADYNDVMYFSGGNVNLGSLSSDKKVLAINLMPEINLVDEINLFINATVSGVYSLKFTDLPSSANSVFLRDSLSQNILTEVKKEQSYAFSIEKNDPATFGAKRFALILKPKDEKEGIPVKQDDKSLSAYPNPVYDEVIFDVSSLPDVNLELVIYKMNGRKAQSLNFQKGEKIKADLSLFAPGIYITKIRSAEYGNVLGEIMLLKL